MTVAVLKGLNLECRDVFTTDLRILTSHRLVVAVADTVVKAQFVSRQDDDDPAVLF